MRLTPGIFVTGTGTGVGNTVASAALLRLAARHGRRVVGLKPVASGSGRAGPDGALRNSDALELQAAASVTLPYELVNPFCFEPAIAPHIASREAGRAMGLASLEDWYRRASAGADLALLEGAGGWRVPLHPGGFLSDLPERLELGVILVVGLTLGCLNHARLTAEALEGGGRCRLLGWIANHVDPGFERVEDNLAMLAELLGAPPLVRLPYVAGPTAPSTSPRIELADEPRLLAALGIGAHAVK
ncbi:MAG: dethiobiotin synthase [Steroidobacteraceae bacterium]